MSAIDTMRDAAAKLRTLAEAASPGEWGTQPGAKGWTDLRTIWVDPDDPTFGGNTFLCQIPRAGDAEYIAAMHPVVALAFADWFELAAGSAESIGATWDPMPGSTYAAAHAAARAVLGGES